jgi:S1-C subfamily serine protease
MARAERDIPANLRPNPQAYGFDLDVALRNLVGLRADVPEDATTAGTLGTERAGTGIVLENGLVLTMSYLVLEAEAIWLSTAAGQALQGDILAIDFETGFCLLQPLGRLALPGLAFGDSAALTVGATAVLAAAGGRDRAIETRVVGRQEFAGFWEYLIEDAIFTSPAHPTWGGAALIDAQGRLAGVGSLVLQQGNGGSRVDMNMVVPTSLLTPVLPELVQHGRAARPPRPWLGIFAMETEDHVVIGGLADEGPAERAGVAAGDAVLALDDTPVSDVAALWRCLWKAGEAGAQVTLHLRRGKEELRRTIVSTDRAAFLRRPRVH